ncbi:MAG TPA: MerR family transcriptional regulator [Beutenbergiaceae bacterium]|nr:MerR family transcriptional regulator [Beutenbergiaceae bacterium]
MDSWLSTGAMSRASGLSIKALRLYHDNGLLPPARVDEGTGYRAYHPDQVQTGRTIRLLRQAGMPIDQIRTAITSDPLSAREHVLSWWAVHTSSENERTERIHRFTMTDQFTANQLGTAEGDDHQGMPDDDAPQVQVRRVGERLLAVKQSTVAPTTLPATIEANVTDLRAHLDSCNALHTEEFWVLYLDPVATGASARIETCVPYTGPASPRGSIALRAEPGGTELYLPVSARRCRYPAILPTYAALAEQARQRGGAVAPPREIYPVPWPTDPDAFAAEVAVRVVGDS